MVLTSLIMSTHYTDNRKCAVVPQYLQVSGGGGGGGREGPLLHAGLASLHKTNGPRF